MDEKSIVGDEFERAIESRFPWEAVVIGISAVYIIARIIPWAVRGFEVIR